MDKESPLPLDLEDQVRLLLKYVSHQTQAYAATTPIETAALAGGPTLGTLGSLVSPPPGPHTPPYVVEGEPRPLLLEEVPALAALFAKTDPKRRSDFLKSLTKPYSYLPFFEEDVRAAQVVAHVLLEIGEVEWLRAYKEGPAALSKLWRSVADKLVFEHARFSDEDLLTISKVAITASGELPSEEVVSGLGSTFDKVLPTHAAVETQINRVVAIVQRVQHLRLKTSLLEKFQPDIERDRRILEQRRAAIGLDPDLDDTLHRIDERLARAVKPTDFKEAMDMMRSFLEGFVKEVSRAAASHVPGPKAAVDSFNNANQSLVPLGVLTHDESQVTQVFYNYLSNASVHKLSAGPEQARVMRTTTIEWAMMIAGRLEALSQKVGKKKVAH